MDMILIRTCWAALFLSQTFVLAADDCTSKLWQWKTDKPAALQLQASVNQGHQPWRVDYVSAVASEAILERKQEWSDLNTVIGSPKLINQSRDTASLTAISQPSGDVRYHVTLRKYQWLLKSAGKWENVIWPTEKVERIQCGNSTR
jgi:hypothetical protein